MILLMINDSALVLQELSSLNTAPEQPSTPAAADASDAQVAAPSGDHAEVFTVLQALLDDPWTSVEVREAWELHLGWG